MADLLAGKSALVIGASQGIGLASARILAQDGATVVITGRREDALTSARDQLRSEFPAGRIEACAGDATSEADIKRALDLASTIGGGLDIIVSVVGEPVFKPLLMREAADVMRELEINFLSAFLAVRHGAPLMAAGSSIVCVSSAAAVQANWGLSIYSSTKAGLERFVSGAAYELASAGIRVNAVRPGATLDADRASDPGLAAMAQAFAANTPMGRLGEPEDVARTIRFLAGSESGWVTGQTFSVDGGMAQNAGPDFMDGIFGKDAMDQIRAGQPPQLAT